MSSTSAAPAPPTSILKKSKASSSLDAPTQPPTSSQTAQAHLLESQLPLPPKKERKPKRPNPDSTSTTEASKPKRAKKDDVVEELPVVEGKKAEKKRLRAEAQAARPPPSPPVDAQKPLVWDQEKNGRNPYEDERLSEAAKKAIAYSQTIQNPFLKFQKARQNFLLRHIYNEDEIPANYLPLVLAYLKTVKGGSRDSLIASASLILNPLSTPTPTVVPTPSAGDAPPSADEPTAEPTTTEPEEEETEEAKEVKRSRARALLEVLGEGEGVGGEGKKEKKSEKDKKSKKETVVEEVVEVEDEDEK